MLQSMHSWPFPGLSPVHPYPPYPGSPHWTDTADTASAVPNRGKGSEPCWHHSSSYSFLWSKANSWEAAQVAPLQLWELKHKNGHFPWNPNSSQLETDPSSVTKPPPVMWVNATMGKLKAKTNFLILKLHCSCPIQSLGTISLSKS